MLTMVQAAAAELGQDESRRLLSTSWPRTEEDVQAGEEWVFRPGVTTSWRDQAARGSSALLGLGFGGSESQRCCVRERLRVCPPEQRKRQR